MKKEEIWFRMLNLVDRLNRSVKEPGWMLEDKNAVYILKDAFLEKLLRTCSHSRFSNKCE